MTKEILLNPGTSPRLLAYNHTLSQHIIPTLGKDEEEDENKKKNTFDGQREVERVTHAEEENKQEGKHTSCCLL